MNRAGWDRIVMALIAGGIVGFFVGYAVNYDEGAPASGAAPVAVAAGDARPVDITPVRKLEPSPVEGGKTPKVIIHEVSDFQ